MTVIIKPMTVAEYQALVSGIPKYCPNMVFNVAGTTYTAAEAVTFVTNALTAVSAVATAKTGWADAKLAAAKVLAQDGPTVTAIRESIALMFDANTTTLAAFLIAPKKPRTPLSAAARAAATAKAKATRLARGTKGKKQKAEISGNVTGVTITPVTEPGATPAASTPSASSSTPTPAPAATSTPSSSAVVPAAGSGVSTTALGSGATTTPHT
jgi:hypothetical protein